MSFFKKSTGENATGERAETTSGGEPITDGTTATSMIEEIKYDEYDGERFISAKWKVLDGEFKNRVAFQKIKVFNEKETTADSAKETLFRLFTLCGATAPETEPTDMELMKALCNKPLAPRFRIWEFDGKKGNWIDAIYAKVPVNEVPDDIDDDIDF